jgi:hypothetical protein
MVPKPSVGLEKEEAPDRNKRGLLYEFKQEREAADDPNSAADSSGAVG